jgi:hypothetical protein
MAGSRKNFFYTDDTGQAYAISLDESNTEAINGSDGDIPDTSTATVEVPRNVKIRELFYATPNRERTIRCIPLTQARYNAVINGAAPTIPDPIANDGSILNLVRANGERRRVFPGVDSGLTDGDAT